MLRDVFLAYRREALLQAFCPSPILLLSYSILFQSDMRFSSSVLSFLLGEPSSGTKGPAGGSVCLFMIMSRILVQYYTSLCIIPIILMCGRLRPRLLFTTKVDGLTCTGKSREPAQEYGALDPHPARRGETVESAGGSTSTPRPTRWFTCIKHEPWPLRKVASRLFTGYAAVRPSLVGPNE